MNISKYAPSLYLKTDQSRKEAKFRQRSRCALYTPPANAYTDEDSLVLSQDELRTNRCTLVIIFLSLISQNTSLNWLNTTSILASIADIKKHARRSRSPTPRAAGWR